MMAKWHRYILDDTFRLFLQQWMKLTTPPEVFVPSPDMSWVNFFFVDNPLDSVAPYLPTKRDFYQTLNPYGVYHDNGVHNDFVPSAYVNAVREAQEDVADPWYRLGNAYDSAEPDKPRYSEFGKAAMWGWIPDQVVYSDRAYTTYFNNRVAAYERLLKWAAGDLSTPGGSMWATYTDLQTMMRVAYKEGQDDWLQHILDFESLGYGYGNMLL